MPSVLQSSIVPLGLSAGAGLAGGGAPPVWQNLSFSMQPQQQTQWCWAAVTASVARFFSVGSAWAQCGLANQELNQTTCCANGSTTGCNQPWYLDRSLQRTGNLKTFAAGTATMNQIQGEITAGRPLGVRIGWANGGGHFVAIDGCAAPDLLDIQDPWYGHSTIDLAHFQTSYQGNGSWTHTYWTQP